MVRSSSPQTDPGFRISSVLDRVMVMLYSTNLATKEVSNSALTTAISAERKKFFTQFFQMKSSIPLHLIAEAGFPQLGQVNHQKGSVILNASGLPGRTATLH